MCVVLIVMKINETCARSGLIENDAIPPLRAFHAGEPSAAAYPRAITAALLPSPTSPAPRTSIGPSYFKKNSLHQSILKWYSAVVRFRNNFPS